MRIAPRNAVEATADPIILANKRIAMIAKEAEGFGISELKQAKKMAAQSDRVIVGSAIVKLCEKYGADCVPHISTFVKEMKDAIR